MGLTKFKEGSVRELWSISLPLMMSELSVMLMLFVDRLLLARYSQDAFNAAVSAGTLGWSFVFGWLILTNISEVFVAQYNGAKKYDKIAAPVWQMIWLSFASLIFFVPLSIWGGDLIYGPSEDYALQKEYLHWMLIFGPSFPLYGALTGFFVGRGKVFVITWLSIAANLINVCLDVVLIFGIEGWVPSLGVAGAAIATCGSQIFQALVLAAIFLSPASNARFNTWKYSFNSKLLKNCVRIGGPMALFGTFEILGWAAYFLVMTWAGESYLTIAGICQSLAILFFFFGEGVGKGVAAIVGNFIGSNKSRTVYRTVRSGFKLHLLFFAILLAAFYFFADDLAAQFVHYPKEQLTPQFLASLQICVYLVLLYLFFSWLRLVYMGVLTASGDTVFLLIAGSTSIWIFLVFPVYVGVMKYNASIETAQLITVVYSFVTCLFYYLRFHTEKWKTISIHR
jgi:multidrug resistance protein, MATE family